MVKEDLVLKVLQITITIVIAIMVYMNGEAQKKKLEEVLKYIREEMKSLRDISSTLLKSTKETDQAIIDKYLAEHPQPHSPYVPIEEDSD